MVSINGEIKYSGSIFGISFGLYGCEDIAFEETKESIKTNFEAKYEDKLKEILEKIGLKYIKLEYFSPSFYNFKTDSLDLVISDEIQSEKLEKYITKYREEIDKRLAENKSRDGYMATTVANVTTELVNLYKGENYEPDIIVLRTILRNEIDFDDFNIHEHFVEANEDEDEG